MTFKAEVLADVSARRAASIPPRMPKVPSGFEPGVKYVNGEPAEVALPPFRTIPENEKAWREEITKYTNLVIPEDREVQIQSVRYWGPPTEPNIYVRFDIKERVISGGNHDLSDLVRIARRNRPRRPPKLSANERTRVVVLSDAQIGKVDRNGGTPELLDRLEYLMAGVIEESRATRCEDLVILDAGDLTEGFENYDGQYYLNDLSHPDQLKLATAILTNYVPRLAAGHKTTRVATVTSNHGAWRKGKGYLGRPGDDYGLLCHKLAADALSMAKHSNISWTIPQPWDESLALQVRKAVIGLAHGHTTFSNGVNAIMDWWDKQTIGGMPVAAASILVTGHKHTFRMQPHGQIDGRDRYWLQAPTMDNGSSHVANKADGDSEPGLVTFYINDEGDWDGLRLIRVR